MSPQRPRSPSVRPPGRAAARPTLAQRQAQKPPSALRFPIAAKYAALTAVLLVVIVLVVGNITYRRAIEEIDRAVDDNGIAQAVAIAALIEPFWLDQDLLADQRRAAQERLHELLSAILEHPGSTALLDLMILDRGQQNYYATAGGSRSVSLFHQTEVPSARAREAGVSIHSGQVRTARGLQAARSYQIPIVRGRETVGHVLVFLSAQAIEELRDTLWDTILVSLGMVLVIAVPLAALVGGLLTRPVRMLKRDMAAVAAGDFTHQSAVRSGDELEDLSFTFNRMTQQIAVAQEREVGRKALERELAIASTIQTALLPDRLPTIPGYELSSHYASAKEVGGDYYDFIPMGDDRYAIVVADVSGKGIPGSLVMTMTRSLVRMAAREGGTPDAILTRVNASLSQDMTRGMFVTLVLAELDAKSGAVRIARAGHNPAYILRADRQLETIQPSGIALGMVDDLFGPNLAIEIHQLGRGDHLVLYTDGVIEAMNRESREYTSERFEEIIRTHGDGSAQALVEAVLDDLAHHTRGAEPSDDITLLVLKRVS